MMRVKASRAIVFMTIICLIAALGGCGSSDPSQSGSSGGGGLFASIAGFVVDGYISGAKIQAYQINANGTKGAAVGSSTTSDATGAYSLNLGNYTGPVLIESSGGSYTDWATGAVVNIPAAGVMRAVVPNVSASTPLTVHITPLTYMAAQRALQDIAVNGTAAATAISNANNQISKYYGSFNILTDKPINPTVAGSAVGVSQTQVDYGMVLAGISQTAGDKAWQPFSLVTALALDATDGTFDGKQGTTQLTVAKNAGGTDNLPATAGKTDMANEIDTFQKSVQNKSGGTTTPAIINDLKATSGTVSSRPDPPAKVTATAASSAQVNLTWDAVNGAEGYKIYRDGTLLKTVSKTVTTLADTGLTPNTSYCYSVTATDSAGNESNKSGQVCAITASKPDPPANVNATAASPTQINLTWSAVAVAEVYKIYRDGTLLKSVSKTVTTLADTGLTPNTSYCYSVTATDSAGYESNKSGQVCAITASKPDPPANVNATAASPTQINLTWSAVAVAEVYKIYRDGTLLKSVSKTVTTLADTGLTPNTSYCYSVTATDSAGNESDKSGQVCVTTSGTPPPVPTGLTATAFSDTQINLTWVSGGGSTTGFKVYRGGTLLKSTATASTSDTGLTASTQYCYAVSAYDIAGNESNQTTQVCATTDPPPTPASIDLLVSNSQMPSDDSRKVTLTALVKDGKNRAIAGQTVSFSSESTVDPGIVTVTQATTDASGQAVAHLGTGGNKSYRVITVKAKAGLIEASNTVEVTGTALYISGQDSIVLTHAADYTVSLKDSAGSPIAGKSVTVTCKYNQFAATGTNTVTRTTDGNGQIKVTLNATDAAGQKDTLTAESSSMGLKDSRVATKDVTVVNTYFVFNKPAADAEIEVNTLTDVEVEYKEGGAPKVGITVNFSTSRGTLSAASAVTDAAGKATVKISSATTGPATISASVVSGPSAERKVEFVSSTPNTVTLQADPTVIGTNANGATKEQSKITAVIRDSSDNFVKNKTVNFTLMADPSVGYLSPATARTDSAGMASVQYVAGSATSGTDGVKIEAQEPVSGKKATVYLTVAKKAVNITLGEPTGISSKDASTYEKVFTVMVTDSVGNPVQGAVVTAKIFPVAYYKGTFVDSGTDWTWNRTLAEIYNPDNYYYTDPNGAGTNYCINEDLTTWQSKKEYALNGILDVYAGDVPPDREDHNKNKKLDPGGIASVTASVTTDANGLGKLSVLYLKRYAPWATVKLQVTTYVEGTEGKDETVFLLKYLVDDYLYIERIPPPNSPFGRSTVCSDAN